MNRPDNDTLNRAGRLAAELRGLLAPVANREIMQRLDRLVELLGQTQADEGASGDEQVSIQSLQGRRPDPMDGQVRVEARPEYDCFRGMMRVRFFGNSMEEPGTFEEVGRQLAARTDEGMDPLAVIDMAGLRDLSDRALMSLALLSRTALGNRGVVILCGLEQSLDAKMREMHLDRMLKIVDSPEDATGFLDSRLPGESLRELLVRSMFSEE